MEKWRLIDVETPDLAAMNLAIDEAIFLGRIEKRTPHTVRFWRNRSAVVVGYSQNVEAEVNLELCKEKGVQVVRRLSGGGAVYQDLGNLNYSMAIDIDHSLIKGLDIGESYRVFSSGVTEGLKEFGIEAVFVPPSDLLVENRKISGNAQSRKKGVVLHHGTLLVNADLGLLTEVLRVPEQKLMSKGATSKKRPVTNLVDETRCKLDVDEVKRALQQGFERVYGVKLVRSMLTTTENRTVKSLYAGKYSKSEWNFWR